MVTSAFCFYIGKKYSTLIVGSLDLEQPFYEQKLTEEEIIIHPDFYRSTILKNTDNIAVIRLKNRLSFGSNIGKIDMYSTDFYKPKANDPVTFLGYPHYEERVYTNLRYAKSQIGNFSICQREYNEHQNKFELDDSEKQFCIESYMKQIVYTGTEGGPVIRSTSSGDKLIGIASFGVSIPHALHGIVTSIYPYRDFILDPNVGCEVINIEHLKCIEVEETNFSFILNNMIILTQFLFSVVCGTVL